LTDREEDGTTSKSEAIGATSQPNKNTIRILETKEGTAKVETGGTDPFPGKTREKRNRLPSVCPESIDDSSEKGLGKTKSREFREKTLGEAECRVGRTPLCGVTG